MSAYGPALFVTRTDKRPISPPEQDTIVRLVRKHVRKLGIKDDDGASVSPRLHADGEHEPGAVAVLIFSSYLTAQMPDDIRADHERSTCTEVLKLGGAIDREAKGVYTFKSYYVED